MREYVITKIEETVDHSEHAIVTMDGIEIYRTYFEHENWARQVEAAVVASKKTAAWFDQNSKPDPMS